MTRENKLALIVAFALILGVSVLLSDHLSSARTAVAGEVHETTRLPAVPQRPIRTLDDVIGAGVAPSERPATPPVEPTSPRDAALTRLALDQSGTSVTPSILESLLTGLEEAPGAVSPERAGATPAGQRPQQPALAEGPLILQQRIASGPPAARTSTDAPTPPTTPATTGPVRQHSVRAGESLFAIAARYYGDGNLWRELARHNQGRVKPDGTVNTGVMLRIPARADLTGTPQAPVAPEAAPATAPTTPRQPARARTYTVAAGDTLGEISRSTLGTSRRWREIYDLNKSNIPDPDRVRTGTVLIIPAS